MNKTEFQQRVSAAHKPVIVDFWATWCGPCMVTKPILDRVAREYNDQIEFMPINADDSREIIEHFHIFGIPTVITFRDGKEVGRITGAQPETGYRAVFEALATGKEIKRPLSIFDRTLRIGGGLAFSAIGIYTSNWLIAGIGAILAFLGVYDRCPIWRALTGMFKRS